MAAETILLVEDSPGERDIAQAYLEENGFKVVAAANAAAALTFPDINNVNLVILDATLDGVSGFETTRLLRQQADTHPLPILMLVPEGMIDNREDFFPGGADGYLLKPYEGPQLVRKVGRLLTQAHLESLSGKYLSDRTDEVMKELAAQHIQAGVERKTQLIIERCLQNVATAVDLRARQEVDKKIQTLAAEKEQELVKMTVREIAQSMVEKLAERKVGEAIETVLKDTCEKAVTRIANQLLPGTIRERVKENLNNTLPREIQTRLQKATEKIGPEMGQQIVATVEGVAQKTLPKVARELLPELAEKQMRVAASEQVPRIVSDLMGRELDKQMFERIDPAVRDSADRLRRTVFVWNGAAALIAVGLGLAALIVALIAR